MSARSPDAALGLVGPKVNQDEVKRFSWKAKTLV